MSSPTKPLTFNSPRASPFRRSPSLSPEKSSPFVRRPSQLGGADRPRSPFARPSSRLGVAESPSRPTSSDSLAPPVSFSRHATPSAPEQEPEPEHSAPPSPSPSPVALRSPSIDHAPSSPMALRSPTIDHTPSSPVLLSPMLSPNTRPQRPITQRTVTSSTAATIRPTPSPFSPAPSLPTSRNLHKTFAAASTSGNYNHIPQPLLRSMRESFEVLDATNSGSISSAQVSDMLTQMGMDASPRALSAFFPAHQPSNLNLGRFLDTLAAPLAQMSEATELNAAFAAFDVDDSGQIDLVELKDALLNTAPEPGAEHLRMNEAEVDAILAQFSARRAFGAKGVIAKELGGGGGAGAKRGDVFRYKDFMASVSGSGGVGGEEHVVA